MGYSERAAMRTIADTFLKYNNFHTGMMYYRRKLSKL